MKDKILYHFFNNEFSIALTLCEQAYNALDNRSKKDKKDKKFFLEYACLSAIKLGDIKKEFSYINHFCQDDKTSFWLLNLAKACAKNMRFNDAFALFEELLKREDELFDIVLVEYALSLKANNEPLKAEQCLQILIDKNPFNLELLALRAELFFINDAPKSLKLHQEIATQAQILIDKLSKQSSSSNQIIQNNLQSRLIKEDENLQVETIKNYLYTKIYPQIAFLYYKTRKLDEALELFNSLRDYNDKNAPFWQNYAKALEFSLNYDEALNAYQKALSIHQHATYAFDMAYLLMRVGRFKEGVLIYENRLFYAHEETFSPRHYHQSLDAFNKDGTKAFEGKVICVFCEQGYGDTIMYSRCLTKLCKIAKKVLFAPQSDLYTLFDESFKSFSQDGEYVNLEVLRDIPRQFDYAIPICSLPLMCDMSMDEITGLKTPIKAFVAKKPKKELKIGLFYHTASALNTDLKRNFNLSLILEALKDLPVQFVSFQLEKSEEKEPEFMEDRAKSIKTWLNTKEALEDIDLVISIDSALAHLALALNVPTLILLHDYFDWRWGRLEEPKSYFWPKANLVVFKDEAKFKQDLRSKTKELLKL